MDTAQWPKAMEESAAPNACNSSRAVLERRARPQEQLNCPRCNSSNTKFCYYNNYSLTQPRYFCKTCRRYWTEGGSLRNVPVGGGSRKNKKIMSSSSANKLPDLNPSSTLNISHHHFSSHQNPNKTAGMPQGQDLNLGFPPCSVQEYYHAISQYVQVPKVDQDQTTGTSSSSSLPLQLRDGTSCPRGSLASFLSGAASAFYPPQPPPGGGFSSHLQELKPSLCFSDQDISNGGKLLFPMGGMNMKQVSNTSDHHHQVQLADGHHHHHGKEQSSSSSGYWSNGMLGGGGSW